LLPGALGNEEAAANESFQNRRLEYPQYTRPREYRGLSVPDVLLSGHHGEIENWRRAQAEERTRRRRPDLLEDRAAPVVHRWNLNYPAGSWTDCRERFGPGLLIGK
jgi:tRNA (guanine37-N1)-methyltransferase